ncbi:lytic transglycosylase domain-containing protein [Candidatus Woesearchaeota archaeon]|nr:lytic transglycosylase domain-containing protein [Candidatus Woesearchaeota archaeon]
MRKKNLVKVLALSSLLTSLSICSSKYVSLGSVISDTFSSRKIEASSLEAICEPNVDSLRNVVYSSDFVWDDDAYSNYKYLVDDTVFGGYSLASSSFNRIHVLTKKGSDISDEINILGRSDFADLLGVRVGEVGSANDLFGNLQLFGELYARIAREEGVDRRLLLAVASVESRFNPYAISRADCLGLNQLSPYVYLDSNPFVHEDNVRESAKYLRSLQRRFGNDTLALTAYNRGPSALSRVINDANSEGFFSADDIINFEKNGRFVLPKESREYADKVFMYKELIRLYHPNNGESNFLALYRSLEKQRQDRIDNI